MAGCATKQWTGPSGELARHRPGGHFVPASSYEAYVRGELLLASGQPAQAARQLELATTAPEEDAFLLSRLAEAYAQSGDGKLAQQTLQEAERVHRCEQNVWLTRGRWAEQKGDLGSATQAYEQALRCDARALPALLALHHVLAEQGKAERGLTQLADLAMSGDARGAQAAFAAALAEASPAEVRFALTSWLSLAPPDTNLLRGLTERALLRKEPALLATMAELPLDTTPETQMRVRRLTADREGARALLAQHPDQQLGGPEQAADDALFAGDYERAELYATLALQRANTTALSLLHARALLALGELDAAAAELRQLPENDRAPVTREALQRLGFPALAGELKSAQ